MRGIWSGSESSEKIEQNLTRHKLLTVNCGQDLTQGWNPCDSSGLASLDPNNIASATHNQVTDMGPEGGPHFVMSPQTSDGSPHSYGFEFCLFVSGIPNNQQADDAGGGWTVTIWELITPTQTFASQVAPIWASFQSVTGVFSHELYHSFDCNATAIRFQIGNLEEDPLTNNLSLIIAFAEL